MKIQLLIVAAVFVGIKVAFAQVKDLPPAQESTTVKLSEIEPDNTITGCGNINREPKFPGGEIFFLKYLKTKLPKAVKEEFSFSFIIKRDGSPDEITIFGIRNTETKDELINIIKNSPKWIPGIEKNVVYYPVLHLHVTI